MWLSLVLHECGHLLGGRAVGCRFVMINAGPAALFADEAGRLRLVKIKKDYDPRSLMSGHCMLKPPYVRELSVGECGKILMAGGLVNAGLAAVAAVALALFSGMGMGRLKGLTGTSGILYLILLYILIVAFVCNLVLACTALFPGRDNDFGQYMEIKADPALTKVFTNLLRIETMSVAGLDVSEMPEKVFKIPPGAEGSLVNEIRRIVEEYSDNESIENID